MARQRRQSTNRLIVSVVPLPRGDGTRRHALLRRPGDPQRESVGNLLTSRTEPTRRAKALAHLLEPPEGRRHRRVSKRRGRHAPGPASNQGWPFRAIMEQMRSTGHPCPTI